MPRRFATCRRPRRRCVRTVSSPQPRIRAMSPTDRSSTKAKANLCLPSWETPHDGPQVVVRDVHIRGVRPVLAQPCQQAHLGHVAAARGHAAVGDHPPEPPGRILQRRDLRPASIGGHKRLLRQLLGQVPAAGQDHGQPDHSRILLRVERLEGPVRHSPPKDLVSRNRHHYLHASQPGFCYVDDHRPARAPAPVPAALPVTGPVSMPGPVVGPASRGCGQSQPCPLAAGGSAVGELDASASTGLQRCCRRPPDISSHASESYGRSEVPDDPLPLAMCRLGFSTVTRSRLSRWPTRWSTPSASTLVPPMSRRTGSRSLARQPPGRCAA